MYGGHEDLLHEDPGESDDDAYDGRDHQAVPVVASWLSFYPLLVDAAVARQVVEDFVLQ